MDSVVRSRTSWHGLVHRTPGGFHYTHLNPRDLLLGDEGAAESKVLILIMEPSAGGRGGGVEGVVEP